MAEGAWQCDSHAEPSIWTCKKKNVFLKIWTPLLTSGRQFNRSELTHIPQMLDNSCVNAELIQLSHLSVNHNQLQHDFHICCCCAVRTNAARPSFFMASSLLWHYHCLLVWSGTACLYCRPFIADISILFCLIFLGLRLQYDGPADQNSICRIRKRKTPHF